MADLPSPGLPRGVRVVVSRFAETPPEAIDGHLALDEVDAPDPATLAPHDVIIAIESAAVGWEIGRAHV